MKKTLVIASSNRHKIREIQQILPHIAFSNIAHIKQQVQQQSKNNTNRMLFSSPEETGHSFFDNALLKAHYYYHALKTYYKKKATDTDTVQPYTFAVLAEDSGLSIQALGGAPGIFSARYGMDVVHKTQKQKNPQWQLDYVLQNMQDKQEREAHFTCAMVLLYAQNNFVSTQATWQGNIIDSTTYNLHHGFGYDPIFYLEQQQCTASMLAPEEKNSISHRAKALKRLAPILENF